MKIFILALACLFLISCENGISQNATSIDKVDIEKKYWSEGLAEINRYELSQERYGEKRTGEQVQIFVSEDFLTDKQVKNETYSSSNSTWVLKRIETRQFLTGIYQYNMFSSVFLPFELGQFGKALKLSSSSQEWCGVTYTQLNSTKSGYNFTMHSYFENEADQKKEVKDALTEEELFTRIRLSPETLPEGSFNMIPSQMVSRFLHLQPRSFKTIATRTPFEGDEFKGENVEVYTLETKDLDRKLEVYYENKSPYKILGWKDSYPSSFSSGIETSKAVLTHQIREKYWQKNNSEDAKLRSDLGLD